MTTKTTRSDRVLRRMRTDFEYWARHCFYIIDKDDRLTTLKLNEPQRRIWHLEQQLLKERGRCRILNLKARQAGFTTAEQAKNYWTIWANPRTRVLTLCDIRENTDKIFRITQTARDEFPDVFRLDTSAATAKEVTFALQNSTFWTGTARAKTAGIGVTLKRLHGSEFAMWETPRATLSRVEPALERPGTSIVLETTASVHGGEAHEMWDDAVQGRSEYVAFFVPWWECDPVRYRMPLMDPDEMGTIEPEEKMLMEQFGLDLEQIKWRRNQIGTKGLSYFLNHYAEDPNTCWLIAGDQFYGAESIRMLDKLKPSPLATKSESFYGWTGHVTVFKHQENIRRKWETLRTVIGVDVAEGGAKDRSAYVVRTYPNWELLEQFADNTIEPKALAALLDKRGRLHADKSGTPALLVVEKNAHGITVLRELRDTHKYPSSRIYHRTRLDKDTKEPKLEIGWATTEQTKPLLLDAGRELINAVREATKESPCDPPSAECVADMSNVLRDDKGKVDLNGKDVLVAEALAWQGRTYAAGGYGSRMEYV